MKYFDRDCSWVEFNARILFEATRQKNPLFERIRFLGIVSTNFDEFFQVRVASLMRSGNCEETLQKIAGRVREISKRQYEEIPKVLQELSEIGIHHITFGELAGSQKSFAENHFKKELFPLLTPLRTDGQFPEIANGAIYAAFSLKLIPNVHVEENLLLDDAKNALSLVALPPSISRIVWLPDEKERSFILLEEILLGFGTQLFPGYSVEDSLLFSVDRDADMGVDEDSGDGFIEAMENVIESRRNSFAVRLLCSKSGKIARIIQEKLNLSDRDVYAVGFPIRLNCLSQLDEIEDSRLKKEMFEPFKSANPFKNEKSIWNAVRERDRILFHPYQSFEPVERLLDEAAEDSKVLAIKITLYRTEANSSIVKSLARAAQNGKQVTVFVELKARFDEKRNIRWARGLEKAGAVVIYGIVNLKVHAKTFLIIRREKDGIRRYVHLATGNYNAKTAQIYSDCALLSADDGLAGDVTLFFNLISGYSALQTMTRLFIAPVNLKQKILNLINREAELSTRENPGLIMAKMNALGDEDVIGALYEAAKKGVKIMLNVRGICRLNPDFEGAGICVKSIVGRYLEHSRILYFKNAGNEELYISSADWMPRNLERRVELLIPVANQECFLELKANLEKYFRDNTNSHELQKDGLWTAPKEDGDFSAQKSLQDFYKTRGETAPLPSPEFQVRRRG